MKVFVKGKGDISLTKANFLTSGGEGDIYVKGNTAFKIYQDPKKMIPTGKLQDLALLTHPDIIKPEQIVLSGNKPVGYTMRYISDTYALCQLFTKAFRDRHGLTPKASLDLVRKLQGIVQHTHDHGILIIDLNELNFLASQKFDTIYAIDVDSYQTPNYPATAIMDSIRDRHATKFTKETDWFSFAIISFMMMIGIHPYKGKHASVKGLDDRMLQNISVFNKDVSTPKACLPVDVIPEVYLKWFKAVLEKGMRVAPPVDLNAVAQIIAKVYKTVGSDNFDIKQLDEFAASIIDVVWSNGSKATLLDNGKLMLNSAVALRDVPTTAKIGLTPKNRNPVVAYVKDGDIKLRNPFTGDDIPFSMTASDIMVSDGRLYFKNFTDFIEVQLTEMGDRIIVSPFIVAQVMEHACKAFDGVLIQNLLGSIHVSIFPESRKHEQIRIKELDDYRIIDAKYVNNVLMVVGVNKKKQYDKLIFRFSADWSKYDLRKIEDISYTAGINFITLDNGTCIHITDDENVEVFRNGTGADAIRLIDDPAVNGDMGLFSSGVNVLMALGNKLHSMTMKKGS